MCNIRNMNTCKKLHEDYFNDTTIYINLDEKQFSERCTRISCKKNDGYRNPWFNITRQKKTSRIIIPVFKKKISRLKLTSSTTCRYSFVFKFRIAKISRPLQLADTHLNLIFVLLKAYVLYNLQILICI